MLHGIAAIEELRNPSEINYTKKTISCKRRESPKVRTVT